MAKILPEGVELSQFLVLLHLASVAEEIGPAKLASAFNVTRGAMSNTLGRLERSGQIKVRQDKIDARRKFVTISEDGQHTLDLVSASMVPIFEEVLRRQRRTSVSSALDILSDLRESLADSA
ncbi:MAG: MarR family winged helix-turn-helix transcriptional regulator [Mangrovicoccus sp.]